jgi:hypothetical protein
MKKFTELKIEEARQLNDGIKNATLMSVSGACGGGGSAVVITTRYPALRQPAPLPRACSWSTNACNKFMGNGFCPTGQGCQK